jgi:eukaryotic-like serine/threonine-protein kinase
VALTQKKESRPGRNSSADRVRPEALSALLKELVAAPEAEARSSWDGALVPGAVFGRLELVREVARGGFGVVWEARDLELGRTVAFKAVRLGGRPEVREERILREAEAAARLSHPNIVTLHDVGRSEHGPYLVLELLRGRTLAERLAEGPLPVREAVRIGLEVAKGLAHAHGQGVVHRDLTPGNVYLCEDGQVKVLDLGMAHAFGRKKLEGGTPAYMAPEQWRGAPEDERTDVFALGAILHRMLSGEAPFPDGAKWVEGSRPAARLEVAESAGLSELVGRMLERDPVERPRDAGEVLAALEAIRDELSRAPTSASVPPVRRRGGRRRWKVAGLVALGVLGGAVAAHLGQRAAHPRGGVASIAVLPFVDMSPQKDQEYFADGLSEEILNALARVEGLHVTGRTSSFAFKGKSEDLRGIGQKLNVGSLLEGSVRKAGDRIRVTAQVIDIASGYHLWSETYDRELSDIFAVQDEIARAVVVALRPRLVSEQAPASRPARSMNPEAYNHYLMARAAYARGDEAGVKRACEAYQEALALDPGYAPAWAGLALPLHYAAEEERDRASRDAKRAEAFAAAERAVALDPELAEGYTARGYLRALYRWDWAGAQADLDRAMSLAPGDGTVLRRYALLRSMIGRPEEAIAAARRAVEVDPMFVGNATALAEAYIANGEYGPARATLVRAAGDLDPLLALLTLLEGKPEEALALLGRVQVEPEKLAAGEALAYHSMGRKAEAQAALATFVQKRGARNPTHVASVYAWFGQPDEAFQWLARAYEQRDSGLNDIRSNVLLKPLRPDARFAALLRKMNLPADR